MSGEKTAEEKRMDRKRMYNNALNYVHERIGKWTLDLRDVSLVKHTYQDIFQSEILPLESENAALKNEVKRLEGLLIEDEIIMTSDSEEIAALKEALAELIPIAERHHKYFSSWLGWLDENGRDDETGEKPDWVDRLPIYKAAIDRAKKLLNKQPQSESDKDTNQF